MREREGLRRAAALLRTGMGFAQLLAWRRWREWLDDERAEAARETHQSEIRARSGLEGARIAADAIASATRRWMRRAWRQWANAVGARTRAVAEARHQQELQSLRAESAARRVAEVIVRHDLLLKHVAWRTWMTGIQSKHVTSLLQAQNMVVVREGLVRAAQLMMSSAQRSKQRAWRCWIDALASHAHSQHAAAIRHMRVESGARRIVNQMSSGMNRVLQRAWSRWFSAFVCLDRNRLAASHALEQETTALREGLIRAAALTMSSAQRSKQRAWRCWIDALASHAQSQHANMIRRMRVESGARRIVNQMVFGVVRVLQRTWNQWRFLLAHLDRDRLAVSHSVELGAARMREGLICVAHLMMDALQRLKQRAWRCWIVVLVSHARSQHATVIRRMRVESGTRRIVNQMLRGVTRVLQHAWNQWLSTLMHLDQHRLAALHLDDLGIAAMREGLIRAAHLMMDATQRAKQRAWRCWTVVLVSHARSQHATVIRHMRLESCARRIVNQISRDVTCVMQRAWNRWLSTLAHLDRDRLAASHSAELGLSTLREGLVRAATLMISATQRSKQRAWHCWTVVLVSHARSQHATVIRRMRVELCAQRVVNQMSSDVTRVLQRAWNRWLSTLVHLDRDRLAASHSAELGMITLRDGLVRAATLMISATQRSKQRAWRCWVTVLASCTMQRLRVESGMRCLINQMSRGLTCVLQRAWVRWFSALAHLEIRAAIGMRAAVMLRSALHGVLAERLRSALQYWRTLTVNAAAETSARVAARSALSDVLLRLARRSTTAAWKAWHAVHTRACRIDRRLCRALERARSRDTARGWQQLLRCTLAAGAVVARDKQLFAKKLRVASILLMRALEQYTAVSGAFRKWVLSAHEERLVQFLDQMSVRISDKSMQHVAIERFAKVCN